MVGGSNPWADMFFLIMIRLVHVRDPLANGVE